MGIDHWEKDEAGDIRMLPLFGFSTLIAAEAAVGLRLDHFEDGDRPDAPSGALQLILTPLQASEIARALQSAVERLREMNVPRKLS